MQKNKSFIGGEEIEVNHADKELFIEAVLFILIGIVCIVFFLTHPDFFKEWFKYRKIKTFFGLLIFLVLSPFGAHLIAKGLVYIWKKIKCIILNCAK